MQGACADGFMWLPKGSTRLSGAPYRFGTHKCGRQGNMSIKRRGELPVCLWWGVPDGAV